MKQETVNRKIYRIYDILGRMEMGTYTGVKIGWVVDQIAWLWKFRHISYDEMTRLTAKARYVISTYKPE